MKLAVCGCSYAAKSLLPEFEGTSWPELMSERLDATLYQFARSGASNGDIRVQIDEAIKVGADIVLVIPTSWDRIEIPVTTTKWDWARTVTSSYWDQLQRFLRAGGTGYVKSLGLANFNRDIDIPHTMVSENIYSLSVDAPSRFRKPLSSSVTASIKDYVNHLYDPAWKQQQDEWIIRDGVLALYFNNIKFIVVANWLWTPETVRNQFPLAVLDCNLTLVPNQLPRYWCKLHPCSNIDPGYHGHPKSQEMIADELLRMVELL